MALINIDESWRIKADRYQWRVETRTGVGAKARWDRVGFYPALPGAVKELVERRMRASKAKGIAELKSDIENFVSGLTRALPATITVEIRGRTAVQQCVRAAPRGHGAVRRASDMAASYAKSKGRKSRVERFVKLTHGLLDSPAWADLNPRARDIFIRLCRKYNGTNNGDLSLTISELRKSGELKSSAALTKAFDMSWRHGFVILTREGDFGANRTCNPWAVTTWPIAEIPGKGIRGTNQPANHWRQWQVGHDAPDYKAKFPQIKKKRQRMGKNKSPIHTDDRTGTFG